MRVQRINAISETRKESIKVNITSTMPWFYVIRSIKILNHR